MNVTIKVSLVQEGQILSSFLLICQITSAESIHQPCRRKVSVASFKGIKTESPSIIDSATKY